MANDYENGVWRTVGGRRIFIRDGEDLSSAMKRSGKFKSRKDIEHQQRKVQSKMDRNEYSNKEEYEEIQKEYDAYDKLSKMSDEELKDEMYHNTNMLNEMERRLSNRYNLSDEQREKLEDRAANYEAKRDELKSELESRKNGKEKNTKYMVGNKTADESELKKEYDFQKKEYGLKEDYESFKERRIATKENVEAFNKGLDPNSNEKVKKFDTKGLEEKFTQKELDNVWKKEDATEVYDTLTQREKAKLAQAHDDADNFNNQSAKDYIKKMDNEAARRFLERNQKEKDYSNTGLTEKEKAQVAESGRGALKEMRESEVKSQQVDIERASGLKVKQAFETDLYGNGKADRFVLEDGRIVEHTTESFGKKEDTWSVHNKGMQGESKHFESFKEARDYLKGGSNSDDKVMSREEYQKLMMRLPNRSDYERTNYEDYVQATKDIGVKETNRSLKEQLSDEKVSKISENQAYKSAYEDYKKKHPNTKLSLQEFVKYSEGKK